MPLAVYGRIYVRFDRPRAAEAMLVCGGRVAYVGAAEVVERACSALGCDEVDVNRGVVMPGLIDAHMHLTGYSLQEKSLDLRGVGSVEELRERLREFASRWRGSAIIGRGWDQERFPDKRMPTRYDIDDVVPDRPVLLIRVCGHVGVANTAALRALGYLDSRDEDVLRGPDGSPTGLLRESALTRALRQLEPPPEEYIGYVEEGARKALSMGLTAVGFMNAPLKLLPFLVDSARRGRLRLRLRLYLDLDALPAIKALGLPGGFGDDMVRVEGVKVFADGSLGARTAYLSEPYSDDPGNRGLRLVDEGSLASIISEASRLGLDVAVHAIGDAALDVVLAAARRAGSDNVRVEHALVVRDDQLAALRGFRVSAQPRFAASDAPWIASRLGARVRLAFRYREMARAGAVLGLSTDAPVEPLDPRQTIYAAMTALREPFTVAEALDLYTRGSAAVLREPDVGTLEPGSLADFVVADRDPLEISSPEEVLRLGFLATYVGGARAY